MKEFTCTCPNCNGKREIRRNKIICPFCDSEWILVDNEPVEETVKESNLENDNDKGWSSLTCSIVGLSIVLGVIMVNLILFLK